MFGTPFLGRDIPPTFCCAKFKRVKFIFDSSDDATHHNFNCITEIFNKKLFVKSLEAQTVDNFFLRTKIF